MKMYHSIRLSKIGKIIVLASCFFVFCLMQGQSQTSLTVEQCLKLAEEKKQSGNLRDATDYLNQAAFICWDLKDYRRAIQYFDQSKELNEQIPNLNGIAGINTNLGLLYADVKEYEKSYEYLRLAYAYRKEHNEKSSVLNALINMSVSLNQLKWYDKTVEVLEDAVTVATELNDFEKLRSCYGMLSEVYAKAGNYNKAAENFLMYKTAHDVVQTQNEANHQAELREATLRTQLAETEREFADKERFTAEARKRNVDEELAQMAKALEGLDAEKRELLENMNRAELIREVAELQKREIEAKLEKEQIKSRILIVGLCVTVLVALIIGYFLRQKKKDNYHLAQQRDQIAGQRKEIMDSILYAQHIQNAVMPDPSLCQEIISDHYLFFRPRDIVSGDFYWANRSGNKSYVAIADCTGHGVPGALMSMLGISSLNEIILKSEIETASEILDRLRDHIKTTMSRTKGADERRDGMDIAFCIIDYDKMELQFAGAYHSLYLVRDGEMTVYKADKMPVGIQTFIDHEKKYTNHIIELQNEDMLYFYTDGFIDQFGGENDTKFKSRPFRQLLTKISSYPTKRQKHILVETLDQWKGDGFQVDDILVMGIRINK